MKFKVIRSSDWFSKPCEKAYEETREIRLPSSLITEKNWIVEINSLEELIAFKSSLGLPIIIETEPGDDDPYPIIEIYDDRTNFIIEEIISYRK